MPESGVERHPQERASLKSATSCSGGDEPVGGQGPGPPAAREFRHSTTSSPFGRDYRKRRDMSPVFGRTTQKAEAGNRRTRIPTRLASAGFAHCHASQCLDSLEVRGVTSMSATLSSRSGRAGGSGVQDPELDARRRSRGGLRRAFSAISAGISGRGGGRSATSIRLSIRLLNPARRNCRRWSRVSRHPRPAGRIARRGRPGRPPAGRASVTRLPPHQVARARSAPHRAQ